MSRIQSTIGLFSGISITDTVDQLMAIAAQPRNTLAARNKTLESEQLAINTLTSLALSVQYEINRFKNSDLFSSKSVASSQPDVLAAALAANGNPAVGSYTFTPIQTATSHQLISDRFGAASTAKGVGSFSLRMGGFIDEGIALSHLNNGDGISRGEIRITDRSGAIAVIDLRFVQTVDDIVNAINSNTTISVTASMDGDAFQLTDNTGQTASNLIVQEVGIGTTAADLGLNGINVAATTATGADVLALHDGTQLALLNDGNGVQLRPGTDLNITLQDGSTLEVDLGAATSLGDVVDALNTADPAKLAASISASGDTIELSDLTTGAGTFAVSSETGGTAAEDLGLTGPAAGGVITSRRLLAGLKSSLMVSLNGGEGFSALGSILLTDRSGATDTANLSSAETIHDVIDAINAANVGITASINKARNGIQLTDTTGATASHLIVANGDPTNTADALGITVDAAVKSVDSGSLRRQTMSEATLLSALNRGEGIDVASFKITDSDGLVGAVVLNTVGDEITTMGGLIDAMNDLAIGVEARINDTGDGILIIDTAEGTGTLSIEEVGSHTTASDLGLLVDAKTVEIAGKPTQVMDGTGIQTIEIARSIRLTALNAGAGVDLGSFVITDTGGTSATIDLDPSDGNAAETIGDVIDAIHATGIQVTARINETGDGILLVDTAGGAGTLQVSESGGTTAADLNILGSGSEITVDGATVHGIDGAGLFDSTLVDDTVLTEVATALNSLDAEISATTFFDGVGYRLALNSSVTGLRGQFLVDTKDANFEFAEASPAQDALLLLGSESSAGAGVLATSSSNTFSEIVSGIELTVKSGTLEPVTVNVTATEADLTDVIQDFVSAYNSLRDYLDQVTAFDAEALTTGILFGTNEALRVDTELARLVTSPYYGVGTFRSLEEIGIEVDNQGKLSLNSDKLSAAFGEDPESLATLFTDETLGVSAKFSALLDQLAGEKYSLLTMRKNALTSKIENNTDRIEWMDAILEKQRNRMLEEFYRMEEAIAAFQTDLAVIEGIQALEPLTVTLGN